jgi:thymidylate kinase
MNRLNTTINYHFIPVYNYHCIYCHSEFNNIRSLSLDGKKEIIYEIQNQLIDNGIVLDRYIFSTIAYHRMMLGSSVDKCIELNLNNGSNFLLPDKIIFITASKSIINERMNKRSNGINEKQWYGEEISLSMDLVSSYEKTLEFFNVPYFHLDTSNLTPKEANKKILHHIQEK